MIFDNYKEFLDKLIKDIEDKGVDVLLLGFLEKGEELLDDGGNSRNFLFRGRLFQS